MRNNATRVPVKIDEATSACMVRPCFLTRGEMDIWSNLDARNPHLGFLELHAAGGLGVYDCVVLTILALMLLNVMLNVVCFPAVKRHRTKPVHTEALPKVSILVPARNGLTRSNIAWSL